LRRQPAVLFGLPATILDTVFLPGPISSLRFRVPVVPLIAVLMAAGSGKQNDNVTCYQRVIDRQRPAVIILSVCETLVLTLKEPAFSRSNQVFETSARTLREFAPADDFPHKKERSQYP